MLVRNGIFKLWWWTSLELCWVLYLQCMWHVNNITALTAVSAVWTLLWWCKHTRQATFDTVCLWFELRFTRCSLFLKADSMSYKARTIVSFFQLQDWNTAVIDYNQLQKFVDMQQLIIVWNTLYEMFSVMCHSLVEVTMLWLFCCAAVQSTCTLNVNSQHCLLYTSPSPRD